jgi:steroid 5-alpha reductase family enzyme
MSLSTLLVLNASLLAACLFALWLLSLKLQDVSFVDGWWALGIVTLALATYFETASHSVPATLLLALTTIWGFRLGLYLLWRWRRGGPDPRYQAILKSAASRRGWSFAKTAGLQVFALQGVLQFIVALPVQLGEAAQGRAPLGALSIGGAALAAFGIIFESIGDWQLVRFRGDPANTGRVLDTGFWRYTRHPNYFGDVCVWWGLYAIAADTGLGAWSFFSPVLVTILLTRVSGVPMLESQLRKKRPGYAEYVARTSGFIPWLPKRKSG